MPSQQPLDEQIYTAMQSGKAFQFNITTGGVKYRAVLRHKEAREKFSGLSPSSDDSSTSASSSSHDLVGASKH